MIEQLLNKFAENGVGVQITLDIDRQPTVHAIPSKEMVHIKGIQFTQDDTLVGALELMKEKLFG
jgi:hypothetical protein